MSLPPKSTISLPHTGGADRRNVGARTPVKRCFSPLGCVMMPASLSPVSVASTCTSVACSSHCGGSVNCTRPLLKVTLPMGRALPPPATNRPTSVRCPDSDTSTQLG